MTSINASTLLSLVALLCACAVNSADQPVDVTDAQVVDDPDAQTDLQGSQDLHHLSPSASLSCSRRCESACSHYWRGRDLSCQFTCEAVCTPAVGVSTPCVVQQQEEGAELETGRGSTHAACWRQCATGCRAIFAPQGDSEGDIEGRDEGDICRDICLRFLSTD